ncbi:DEAD/DEAH box helicase [Sunxiuqinia elliptica]|uniref:SNF2 family DNA or RNA helicase n=1 Tax=Sunxiuqinia elliptica TaxID=655355 RepID=A0A4R6GSQ8_9BACT|nr:DEAD/DEAH box helicase [Sunxiuqinia elliptica]TDN98419.1 SNF2 family DNA or RNA helicase [Sunxiuqinia elliptica]TDO60522.1 SNF2 family DNA or RNA helicase [Sunxiuqinia elliptica]
MALELIIGLTEHRTFGNIFQAFLIEKRVSFYSIAKLVKLHDLPELKLNQHQEELVRLCNQYSDEALVKKFSKQKESGKFFQEMDHTLFQDHISPYIDQYMRQIALLLMQQKTRLFFKQVKYSNLYDEDRIEVPETFSLATFCFERNDEGTRYSLAIEHEGKPLNIRNKNLAIVTSQPCSFVWQNKMFLFRHISAKKLLPFLDKEFIQIPKAVEDKYFETFILNTVKNYPVKASGFTIENCDSHKSMLLSMEPNLQMEPVFVPRFKYGEAEYLPNNKSTVFVNLQKQGDNYHFKKYRRDFDWETQQLQFLEQLGLEEKTGTLLPKGLDLLDQTDRLFELLKWIGKHKQELHEAGIDIQQNQFEKRYSTATQDLDVEIKTSEDWFDIYAKVRFGDFEIPFIKLKRNILNGIREFELPNGEVAILPKEWFAEYEDLLPFAKQEGQALKLRKYHYQLLKKRLKGIDKTFFQRLEKIGQTAAHPVALPSNIQATLRSYQEEGFSWMYHLYEHQFGGCLADDMGLGKTLQTLTLLLKLKRMKRQILVTDPTESKEQGELFEENSDEQTQPAALIVMPTSLIHNWENEIKKFVPSMKAYKYVGVQRKKALNLKGIISYYDIILTTYGTVRNDYELLKEHEFFYLILDESQNIKNSGSKTYQTITKLNAKHRLVLTGTPIENSLSDLWSQINFLNKGLLGNQAYFKREFITPIEKKNDPEKQEKLKTLIRPFVLRRTKEEVARDLPPLTEQIRYCGMSKEQHKSYEREKSIIRNSILQNIEKEGMEKSAIVILQGLTKLRQLANHPSMVQGNEQAESGKFDEIFRSLKNLMAEKHKVLIFSSFVSHLELLKEKIESEKWKYSILTGRTTKREKVIRAFQEDPENRIFLISLKAGGVGLNLTSADYVFIIDPWWNPAAENQAINRAHRIGQDKKVFVYRFITEASIEEKIQLLKERKSSLAEKFVNSNNPFQAITQKEIINLLS